MALPFTVEQFLAVFARYNQTIWPLQVVAYVLGALALILACWPRSHGDRIVAGILALMWLWTGLVYHLVFFVQVNPAAMLFGAAFLCQAGILAVVGGVQCRLHFRLKADLSSVVGVAFVAYAMVLYPILGTLQGHGYPSSPSFGVTPCPLTIFTFGLLFLSKERISWYVLLIPLAWSVVGSTAAVSLGIVEDLGLLVAGIASIALLRTPDGRPTVLGHRQRFA